MRLIQQGPKNAKIVIVGEAPGATEEQSGVPFSGGSGEILNKMLSNVGIHRSDCFITNVCHVRPPGNVFEWFLKAPQRPLLALGLLQLKKDLEEIKPNLVIAMGSQPLKMLTGKQGIDKWRGSVLDCTLVPGIKVIGTYHPAYIMRIWDYKAVAEFDLRRALRESAYPEIRRPQREFILNPPREQAAILVEELKQADWLAVDIECWATDTGWKLACVGFSDRWNRAVVFPCTEQWQLDRIKELCESPVKKVYQNGQFDVTVLGDEGIHCESFAWDTMYAHHALFAECASGQDEMSQLQGKKRQSAIQKGLAFQTSIYTDEPFYKDDGKLWTKTGDINMFWRYNALDAMVTREIRDIQERELHEFGTYETFRREMDVVIPLMKMMKRGIKIDSALADTLRANLEVEIANLQRFLDLGAGKAINVKSSRDVPWLLYEKLGLPKKMKKRKGKDEATVTADKDAINELAGKHNNPLLHTVLKIRQRRDFIERYLDASVDSDGKMHCSFDPSGTRSGRLSSRKSIYGSGTNLQNIPARTKEGEVIRRMFIADTGKVFVYRDYSQAEARIVAYLAEAEELINLFNDPTRDVHCENAARIYNKKTVKRVSDGGDISEEERYLAKRVVHASNYGMGAKRLVELVAEDAESTGIRINEREAQQLINKYFFLYPSIKEIFWKDVERDLKFSRTLNTPFGRKRTFFGRWDDKLMREAYSYVPQSTVGDLGVMAITRCHDELELKIPGVEVLLNVHDSILVQCNEADVKMVADRMEEVMNIPITVKDRTFTIPTDCKVGHNWGARPKKTPEDNPLGLVELEKWLKERA